jgi:putative transposase
MLSISRQCELLGLSRASYYYRSERDDRYNQRLMNLIDEQFTRLPFYGVERMTAWLNRQGHSVNVKRIRRLMRRMDLEAIYPKPRLSLSSQEHKRYPYLLSELIIDRPNQVWCADITYIRMLYGFIYLVAIMDWFSRYILAWETSTTLETAFCVQALEKALKTSKPEIFNTDQGVQFTSVEFIEHLQAVGIRISMDGVVAGSMITSSWNVFGERSSMRKSIFMITRWSRRHGTAWQGIFCFTTGRGCIPLWEIELLMRSISSNRSL